MYHPLTQIDSPEERDRRSLESGILCDLDADPTRQEFAQEADINWLVQRYGGQFAGGVPPKYGDNDFDIDLTTAYERMAEAQAMFDALPLKLRQAYPSITSLVEALEGGELSLTPDNPVSEAPAATQEPEKPVPAGAPPANPSAGTA
nr:MAG: internal scaffolding protein [Microvirus sp.]